jgi:hypothetical protein
VSFQLLGLEGSVSPETIVVWGAAAVLLDGRVVNTMTRRTLSVEEARSLARDGHLHLIVPALEIDDAQAESPLIVTRVDLGSPLHRSFLVDRDKIVGVAKTQRVDMVQFYVFEDRASFDAYAHRVEQAVLRDVLYSSDTSTAEAVVRHRNVVRTALTLLPSSPELNALRVYLGPTQAVERVARASLRGDIALRRFDRFLSALQRSADREYELKYEHGAATGGGLDVDIAAGTLKALTKANRLLRFPVQKDFPFLQQPPPFRLQRMEAASAHMYFVANARDDETLGERVARYLSLELLENALDGRVELTDTDDQRALETTVQKIIKPTPDTDLRHKRLAEEDLQPVAAPVVEVREPVRSERMDFLGVISGLKEDNQAELQLAPNLRISVSTETTGEENGGSPDGADTIRRDGRFLRRPCLISLVRQHIEGDKPKFFLQALHLLNAGEQAVVTALPSSVVEEAFMVGLNLTVTLSANADQIDGDLGQIAVANSGTLEAARNFLEALSRASNNYELTHTDPPSRWLHPSRPREAPSLARVIVVLQSLQGAALVDAVRIRVEKRFGKPVRRNNTRREALDHPDLLTFDAENPHLMRLTDRGAAYYRVYVAAGGVTQRLDQGTDA